MLEALAERCRLLRAEPLAKYTAARLGGPADWVYIARESNEALVEVVSAAWAAGIPTRVLGGGANVLVADRGFRGLVVINRLDSVTFADERVEASAGASLTTLARRVAARGLAGFEWAASVPGTVGGAVVNNAGAHGADMASNVVTVELIDAVRGRAVLTQAELAYGYRTSALKARADRHFLVLSAILSLKQDDPAAVAARIDANIAYRKRTQPPGASLGSIFKNPPGDYAGRLIEACGLKGCMIGGAQISPVHANFFINLGAATAADYRALIEHARAVVAREQGVELETEIELLGDWEP
ncbi:MAG: UDP-N-acetylmuramate dehydrogenase [Aggregatilineales bacterium]